MDPNASARNQPVFWAIQTDPAVILLESGHAQSHGSALTADALRAYTVLERSTTVSQVLLWGQRFDIDLVEPAGIGPLAAVVLLDQLTPDRLTALGRFWSAIRGKGVASDPRVTPQRRQRARQMLRVIDARASGATYRTIAEKVFPNHHHDAASWVGSAIRETTIRLARDGLKLVRGGYRALLQQPRRGR